MALATFTGRVTDFSRKPFATSEGLQLRVMPAESAYGGLGILARKPIPVSVASDGTFSVRLETSSSTRPGVLYSLQARWLGETGWAEWVKFRAPVGGGNIKDTIDLPLPPGAIAYGYGPPEKHGISTGIYIDISGGTPVLYAPEGARV